MLTSAKRNACSATTVACIILFGERWGIYSLAAGILAGTTLELAALGLTLKRAHISLRPRLPAATDLAVPTTTWRLGYDEPGFAFDNELIAHDVKLDDFAIDNVAVSWRRFLPAIEAGAVTLPRYLRQENGAWQALRYGAWEALNLDTAALHLTWDEVQAWCAWAGRRLPTETEWECAALTQPGFDWGDAWEWTASRFAPFEGFVAHPYRDYSRFGFEEHRYVLKGANHQELLQAIRAVAQGQMLLGPSIAACMTQFCAGVDAPTPPVTA